MQNFALWALVTTATITAIAAVVALCHQDPELKQIAARVMRRPGPLRRATIAKNVASVGNGIFFLLVAIGAGDWRWAAVYWVPFAAGMIGQFLVSTKHQDGAS